MGSKRHVPSFLFMSVSTDFKKDIYMDDVIIG